MSTYKEDTSAYTAIRDITLDIHWDESHYPEDDPYYRCTVSFPVPHLQGESVKMDYSDESQSEIMSQITQDIADYLADPQEWTEVFIKKGVEPVLKLRQMEHDLATYREEQEHYMEYASQKAESIKRKEQEIARHKAQYGL